MTQLTNIKGINTRFEESNISLTKEQSKVTITVRKGLDVNFSKITVSRNSKIEMEVDYPNDKVNEFLFNVKREAQVRGYEEVV